MSACGQARPSRLKNRPWMPVQKSFEPLGHLLGFGPAMGLEVGERPERLGHILGQHLDTTGTSHVLGRLEDALSQDQAPTPGDPVQGILLSACHHDAGGEFHLAERIGRRLERLFLRRLVGFGQREIRIGPERPLEQPQGPGEGREAHVVPGLEDHRMDGESEALAMGAEEIEAAPGIDDEDPGAMHREGMEQHGIHGRGLARARGSQDQHVGVLLAVLALQGIEGQKLACAVEEHHARAPGPGGTPVERQEARDVAREGQPATPPDAVEVGLVVHGQVLDVSVEGDEIMAARDRLDAVGHEERVEPVDPLLHAPEIRGPEVEGLHQGVDLIALGDRALCRLPGLARQERLRALADGRAHDPRDVVQDLVLRPEHDDEGEHRALRHLIEEREGLIAQGPLGGVVAGLRGPPQALDGDASLRHAVEPPNAALPIRARRAQQERIGEVPPEGQILVAGIGHAIEQPIGASVPERRSRIEPGHEPLVEHAPIPATRRDTGGRKGGHDPHADIVQLGERQRGLPLVPHPPVDHRPHPTPAPPPAPTRHPVLEEPRRRADAREVRL